MPSTNGSNITKLLTSREEGSCRKSVSYLHLQMLAEDKAATSEMEEIHCKLPSSVRSTFLMAFSPDGTKVASTHGDHKIYVCDVRTGKLLHTLEGHPRTPWCLAFHPSSNDILASGCLGGEVRVWDLHGGSEKWGADQNTVITSLAFHPLDKVLVIATFNQIHFWDWSRPRPFATCKTCSEREKVRFVKFDLFGNRLITGISNLPSENLRSGVLDSLLGQGVSRPPPSHSILSQRRSILTRLMSMYRHLEGLEELSRLHEPRSVPSPTQEDALNQAREYAEATTQANRFRRQYQMEQAFGIRDEDHLINSSSEPSTSGFQQDNHNLPEEIENSEELADTPDNNVTRDFWTTFQRLRAICSSLERRMQHHHHLQQNTESQADNRTDRGADATRENGAEEASQNLQESSREQNSNINTNNRESYSRQNAPQSLINLLTRLQNSLQNAALTTAFAQEQIHQVRLRISEILERLSNVSGYRARLTSLRDQIYEAAERTVQRGEDSSPSQRWDLAHCLWLVEMSLQLTRQMQRILQADYRLTQLHLSSSTSQPLASSESTSNSSNYRSLENMSARSCTTCNGGLTSETVSSGTLSHLPQTDRQNQNRTLNRFNIRGGPNEIIRPRSPFRRLSSSLSDTSGNIQYQLWQENVLLHLNRHSDELSERVSNRHLNESNSPSENSEQSEVRSASNLRFNQLENSSLNVNVHTPNSAWPEFENILPTPSTSEESQPTQENVATDAPESTVTDQRQWRYSRYPDTRANQELSDPHEWPDVPRRWLTVRRISSSNTVRHTRFNIPEVQIEPSTSPPEESTPLPYHERPRSPPLSAILSGDPGPSSWGRIPPYLSMLYDGGFRPRLGIHESAQNFTHRIQSWDFSKCQIPIISNAKANIVVPKCKIHNDASVDISSNGELLAALVPTTGILTNSVMLAVYSLKPQTLGQCLYTWGFESNAISVSLSPLGQYVVVGLASSRLYLSNTEKETVAQIFKLDSSGKCVAPIHVRSLTQQIGTGGQHPQVSLNSVQWLPQPGQGLIYGTNKGCLCICNPVSPMNLKKFETSEINRTTYESNNLTLGVRRTWSANSTSSSSSLQMSASTQTTQPQTQTTGTQTSADGNV